MGLILERANRRTAKQQKQKGQARADEPPAAAGALGPEQSALRALAARHAARVEAVRALDLRRRGVVGLWRCVPAGAAISWLSG